MMQEKEIGKLSHKVNGANLEFDASNRFLFFSSLFGIHCYNIDLKDHVLLLGKEEAVERF
jgi:hypothetical protein